MSILGLVLTTTAGLTATQSASAASLNGAPVAPASRGVALTWAPLYMSDDHSYSAAEATSLARRFDVVAAMPVALDAYAASMKQTNPNLSLIAYTAATLLGKDQTAGVPEAAFAHDSTGHRITYTSFNKWLMETTNPVWMQLASDQCVERSTSAGYDGCLVDMMGTGVVTAQNTVSSRPASPITKLPYTEAQYQQNLINLMGYYRVQDPGMVLVPNSVGNSYRYWKADVSSSTFTNTVSAAQMEDFLRGANDPVAAFPTADNWKLNVDVIRDFEAKGKAGFFTTKIWPTASASQVSRWQKYSMASFLMGANGHSYFAFLRSRDKAGASQTNVPYSMPQNLGLPTGAMVGLSNGAYTRRFANGFSVVNPTATKLTVTLPSAMKSLDGIIKSKITLPPSTGEVFTVA